MWALAAGSRDTVGHVINEQLLYAYIWTIAACSDAAYPDQLPDRGMAGAQVSA